MPGPYDTLLAIGMDEADISALRVAGLRGLIAVRIGHQMD